MRTSDSAWSRTIWHAPAVVLAFALSAGAAAKSPSEKWEKDIRAFEAADSTNPPPRDAVLFLGSSSIRLWKTLAQDFPEHRVINRGFGGSEVADSVYFADRIVIPYRPRLVVMFAGSNDINAGKTPERVFADFRAFVTKVRAKLPGVRIAYMAINPCPARWAQADQQRQANQLIQDYVAAGMNLDFIDIFAAYLGPDGKPRADLFVRDGLHNNAAGYKIRAALTRPHLGASRLPSRRGAVVIDREAALLVGGLEGNRADWERLRERVAGGFEPRDFVGHILGGVHGGARG